MTTNYIEILTSGSQYAIHKFKGFVDRGLCEYVTSLGLVISHTDLTNGEMKWLISTALKQFSHGEFHFA